MNDSYFTKHWTSHYFVLNAIDTRQFRKNFNVTAAWTRILLKNIS